MKIIDSPLVFLLLVFIFSTAISAFSSPVRGQSTDSLKFILGEQNLGQWGNGLGDSALAPGPGADDKETLVLAAKRTKRPDILCGFRWYHGGWDITNRHYWASVGFTGAAGFILATLWFISFGVALVVHHCCGWRINIKGKGSTRSQRICLILLIVFTCAAAIGCIFLSVGQNEFYGEALQTLKYVVNQSDYTVQTLTNVTDYLTLAKTINVAQVFLPSNVKDDIDRLNVDLNTAANTLMEKTNENSSKMRKVFHTVRSALITVASVMLVLSLLGLFLSILGYRHAVLIFIVGGWFLVAITFILCGGFIILNNAISDTCMAMEEWVDNPHAETALSSILPCVDQRTTNHTLVQSKKVITDIVNIVNQVIYTIANSDLPNNDPKYYNQSGPLMPPLCYPFDSQLQDQQCGDIEVSIANASVVWQNYTCMVSASGLCASVGRVTPSMFGQLVAAVNISYALEHYAPPLLSLQDCNFVRQTFLEITSSYCPPLDHHLQMVNAGLGLISTGVMLCLILWILYANRSRREEVFVNLFSPRKSGGSAHKNTLTNDANKNTSLSTSPTRSGDCTAQNV
ncbi:uncharacterized protein LOC131154148 [Malania oleifera]|uniref:uncharacterized protein LOC131154148 n=1 Tax=Malania oleifera TaxID=397392 RepID=UPI0025AE96AE|nr:uncharacterized protein LOC131154148 [Malania oleifera]